MDQSLRVLDAVYLTRSVTIVPGRVLPRFARGIITHVAHDSILIEVPINEDGQYVKWDPYRAATDPTYVPVGAVDTVCYYVDRSEIRLDLNADRPQRVRKS